MAGRQNYRYLSEIHAPTDKDNEEEEDEEKAQLYKEPMRRNLLDVFDKTEVPEIIDTHMNVYLRIRPFSDQEMEANESQVTSNYFILYTWRCSCGDSMNFPLGFI